MLIMGSIILSYFSHFQTVLGSRSKSNGPPTLVQMLNDLQAQVSALPQNAFAKYNIAERIRKALCNDIEAIKSQVNAGAYTGAISKLENDFRNRIEKDIVDPWKTRLIEKVNSIIDAFGHYV